MHKVMLLNLLTIDKYLDKKIIGVSVYKMLLKRVLSN